MIPPAELAELVRRAFVPTDRAVVGLVEGLLEVAARVERLRLSRRGPSCELQVWNGRHVTAYTDTPLDTPGVFRAALARFAVLCNEFAPGSVSPYGGVGQLVVPGDYLDRRVVSFQNRPGEQWLMVGSPVAAADTARSVGTDARADSGLVPVTGTDEPPIN